MNHSFRCLSALVAGILLLGGCSQSDISVYRIAKETDTPAVAPMTSSLPEGHPPLLSNMPEQIEPRSDNGPLAWKVPHHWTPKPAGAMRIASFDIATQGKPIDASIVMLAGEAGGDLANVNRWRGQLNLNPWTDQELNQKAQRFSSTAGSIVLVFLAPESPSSTAPAILAAILPFQGQSWFFKLSGSYGDLNSQQSSFIAFLKSLHPKS